MKLSTKSRYATRLMLDMAKQYNKGAIQSQDIAKHQNTSQKYLEQIIIPLKRVNYIKSVRGAKGGHLLAKPPEALHDYRQPSCDERRNKEEPPLFYTPWRRRDLHCSL